MERTVADQCADLATWLPALADALARDTTTSSGRSMVLSAGSVVNPDVLHAIVTLSREIPSATNHAAQLCHEAWHPRPIATCLRAIPRFHDRLTTIDHIAAKQLGNAVGHWTSTVKYALGLRRPDTPVGVRCPWCDPASGLLLRGDEGTLTAALTVIWQHSGLIWCPACEAEWTPGQWRHLGLMAETG
jgi:hypothetical protein